MSDLSSSRCGCDCGCDGNNGGFPVGNSGNSCACNIIWIILLLSLLNNNSDGCGCSGNGISSLFGNGSSCSTLIWILLLSSCCGCGNGIF